MAVPGTIDRADLGDAYLPQTTIIIFSTHPQALSIIYELPF